MKKLACITLDMEPDYGDPENKIRLLEDPRYFERYVSVINKYNARVTMFTVTCLFDSYGDLFQKLAARIPLEFAAHSHTHDPQNACSLQEVQNSYAAYQNFTGNNPLGYRAPIGRIDKDGLGHLLDHGFAYDASVYPSFRPGKFGYNNLHMPNMPFRVTHNDGRSLVEFPFTSIETIRIVFALSYAKLFGWAAYSLLLKLFGLPKIALLLSHPYDFYFGNIPDNTVKGMEGFAMARNTGREFEIFENMLTVLQEQGYDFVHLSEVHKQVQTADLKNFLLENWK
jgi:peptidoglycan/xylan/chitin deacetylase (PgdA/CDA1 family)